MIRHYQDLHIIKNVDEFKIKLNDLTQAVQLSKLDLTTGLVREFPELQGIIGKIYADKEGIDKIIANSVGAKDVIKKCKVYNNLEN